MDDDDKIRCFQHCRRDINILCFSVPRFCPICGGDTAVTESRIPPYSLPSPFCVSNDVRAGIVIRPTHGDFIRNYTDDVDLHVGITDSTGRLFDFDEEGLHVGNIWRQCVPVWLPGNVTVDPQLWNQKLIQFADVRLWCSRRYHEQVNNCFDFVLRFLQSLNIFDFVPELRRKSDFASKVVAPGTTKAAQFVTLFREVKARGFVCQRVSS